MRKFIDIIAGEVTPSPSRATVLALLEAAKAYEQMMDSTIAFLEKLEETCEYDKSNYIMVADKIRTAAKSLRNDRNLATWFTRWARAALIASLGRYFSVRTKDSQQFGDGSFGSPQSIEIVERYANKVVQDYLRQTKGGTMHARVLSDLDREITDLVGKLEHSKTVEFGPIQNYTFTDQPPERAVAELESLEQRFLDRKNTSRHLAPRPDDQIVLKLDDDFAWWLLPRKSCTDEKNAMSHCGNTASPREGQQILSLREFVGKENGVDRWMPHATFIMNADGTLGERKGFGNHKIKDAFFKYVTPLLKQPWIKGLVRGAHASMNDFAISWLPESEQRELLAANPSLASISDRYRLGGMTEELAHTIANGVQKVGQDWYSLNDFTLDELKPEDREMLFTKYPFLMGIKDMYERHGVTQEFADVIADGYAREKERFYHKNGFNPRSDLSDEELHKLWDFRPDLMSYEDRIRRFGMDDTLMDLLRRDIVEGTGETPTKARNFIDHCGEDNRDKLFKRYPETMRPHEYYPRLGMTPEFKEMAINGLKDAGIAWFKHFFIMPAVEFTGAFDPWDLRSLQDPETLLVKLTPEDTEKLFEGEEALLLKLFPHAHYKKHGVTDELVDQLKTAHQQTNYHKVRNKHFPFHQIDHDHLDQIIDKHPAFETAKDYYRRHGMDKDFAFWLYHEEMGDRVSANEVLDFVGSDREFEIRRDLSEEDREKLFKKFPDLMTLPEHYERRGMDRLFLDTLAVGWRDKQRRFLSDEGFEMGDLAPEDREKLFKKHPEYFPMKEQLALKPEKFLENVKAIKFYDAPWGDGDDLQLTEDKKFIRITEFKDVPELIEELGGSELQHYAKDDLETHDIDWDDDPGCMESVLPYAVRMKIGEYAAETYSVEASDDDDDEVEEERINPKRWSEVMTALEENDDPLYDSLRRAASEGHRIGYESEVHKAVVKSIENVETHLGYLEVTKTDDGRIAWDRPIYFDFSLAEMAEFIDDHCDADGYCSFDSYKSLLSHDEIRFRETNFDGFDDEAALDSFLGEADDDVWEGAPKNPYRKVVDGRSTWQELSRKDMIAELEKLYAATDEKFSGYMYNYQRKRDKVEGEVNTFSDLTDEELTKLFRNKVESYYLPY